LYGRVPRIERHFLFTSSVTFAAGCIVQPQHHAANNRTADISAGTFRLFVILILELKPIKCVTLCSNFKGRYVVITGKYTTTTATTMLLAKEEINMFLNILIG